MESWPDGAKYEGDYIDGKKEGKGKLTFADGSYYEGEFKENKRNGYGKRFIKGNTLIYEGEW